MTFYAQVASVEVMGYGAGANMSQTYIMGLPAENKWTYVAARIVI